MIKMLKQKRQKGATLLELVMFIGLAALILIGGVVWYQTASEGQRVADAVSDLNAMSSLVRNTFTTQNNFSGLTNTVVTRSSQFPDKMRQSDPALIKSGWADDGVTINASTNLAQDDSFTITYNAVPEGACIDFTSRAYRFFDRTQVNGNPVTTVADISTECSGANNAIEYRAR